MIVNKTPQPVSAFLSIEKDMGLISNMILRNPRLKKLLYYTTPDCLNRPGVEDKDAYAMFGKNIKIIPKLQVDGEVLNYIIINFDNFSPNFSNPEFRDNVIEFDIICHYDQWNLGDFRLRPYKIAAEIDSMFNNKHLTGIGTLQFLGAKQLLLSDEYGGICLMYNAIHGDEDKKGMANMDEWEKFARDYNEMLHG